MKSVKFEAVRFGIYLSIPVIATYVYAQPDCINYIINKWRYITYPPQAISREEFYQRMREIAKESNDEPTPAAKK